jgi:hypothetical protein
VFKEFQRRQQLPLVVDAESTVSGWLVWMFPWSSKAGQPDYTFTVIDELNETYEAKRKLR